MITSISQRIGVFDSGVGGLTVLRGLVERLPQYEYCYLADTANLPYGERSQDELFAFTKQAVEFFFTHDCSLVILACNTVSSQALRTFQQTVLPAYPDKKVLGVLVPLAEAAVDATHSSRIGVLATQSTVDSGAFTREIIKLDPAIMVTQQTCPLLVSLIESGEHDSVAIGTALDEYLQKLLDAKVDTIILGCTHYSILEEKIQEKVGDAVVVISAAQVVPEKLADYLARHQGSFAKPNNKPHVRPTVEFSVTSDPERFDNIGSRVYGERLTSVQIEL